MADTKDLKLKPEEIQQFHAYRESHLFHRALGVPLKAIGLTENLQGVIQQNVITYWEQLVCAGYNPAMRQLEATVSVKRATGYSGDLCSDGSPEYVRFFVDWGSGLVDVGLNSVQVYNVPEPASGTNHPLSFLVILSLDEKSHRRICTSPVVPVLRAVLSWNVPPGPNPNDPPHFGNVIDTHIQIQPGLRKFKDIVDISTVQKLGLDIDLEKDVPLKAPALAVDFNALLQTHIRAQVPPHRTIFGAFHPLLAPHAQAFAPQYSVGEIEKLKIDWAAVVAALNKDKANVDFEEVTCAGLNPTLDTVGAVVHVKLPSGYSGDLCSAGSYEYVAFWADFNNDGTFDEYLGTANVKVHDINPFPAGGIDYSVLLPVDFSKHLKSCKTPQVIGLRAVMSWATPPSTTDPNDLKTWGNRLDVKVLLRRLGKGPGGLIEQLYDIGNVPLINISNASYLAYPSPASTGPGSNRPWGGLVRIGGRIQGAGAPPSVWFKVEYANHGVNNWQPVTTHETFEMMYPLDFFNPQHDIAVNAVNGWLEYLENFAAFPAIFERTAKLSTWNTNALTDGPYDLRLAFTTDNPNIANPTNIDYSLTKTVVICNTRFQVSPTPNVAIDFGSTLDLIITGGDCHKYSKQNNDTINGELRVVHPYFGSWNLDLQPTTHTHGITPSPSSRSFVVAPDTGDADAPWTLAVGGLDACGYTVTLWGYDRTIVDSNGAIVHWDRKAVGFSVV
jgi:hypothetical protein